ncbi:hypothetical protein C8J57DRAFT_1466322 [Mycena rebaudengoi]|nr:hypothetical protein C8J57DRAFT_1466322 [Mycena rebaudengoi]
MARCCTHFAYVAVQDDSIRREARESFKVPLKAAPRANVSEFTFLTEKLLGGKCSNCGKFRQGPPWCIDLGVHACSPRCFGAIQDSSFVFIKASERRSEASRNLAFEVCAGGRFVLKRDVERKSKAGDTLHSAETIVKGRLPASSSSPSPIPPQTGGAQKRYITLHDWKQEYVVERAAVKGRNLEVLKKIAEDEHLSVKDLKTTPTLSYFLGHWATLLIEFATQWPGIKDQVLREVVPSATLPVLPPGDPHRLPSLRRKLPLRSHVTPSAGSSRLSAGSKYVAPTFSGELSDDDDIKVEEAYYSDSDSEVSPSKHTRYSLSP